VLWKIDCCNPSIFLKLFDAQIVPVLLYASEIWGVSEFEEMEKVHLYACKRLLNVGSRTPNQMVYDALGRYPLFVLASTRCVSYWLRLCTLPSDRFASMAYSMLKDMDDRGKVTWATKVKDLIFRNGFGNVWEAQKVGNKKNFLRIFKQRLIDCSMQNWSSKLSDSGRFTVYRSFKSSLVLENYFEIIHCNYVRNMYIKFQLGVTELRSNTTRYQPTNAATKDCPFC